MDSRTPKCPSSFFNLVFTMHLYKLCGRDVPRGVHSTFGIQWQLNNYIGLKYKAFGFNDELNINHMKTRNYGLVYKVHGGKWGDSAVEIPTSQRLHLETQKKKKKEGARCTITLLQNPPKFHLQKSYTSYGNGYYAPYFTRCTTHLVIQRLEYDSESHLWHTIKLSLSTHISEFRVKHSQFPTSLLPNLVNIPNFRVSSSLFPCPKVLSSKVRVVNFRVYHKYAKHGCNITS